ncbi:5-hydroxytryptamine receptor 1-like [Paramuricea clavata]|uniref:5-hydroxytryptamine receptor 1-like n=1 Tax=Paramuricea clavata TaxID=317549 RepID=A0A6S7JG43_PARCT|nr:5-hydroxytryptamine receptor 1-like [Paramuricea clavata]
MYYNSTESLVNSSRLGELMKLMEFRDQLESVEKIIFIFISIFTILGNTMVLVATWRERSLHQPNKYCIACLAVADLLVGIFVAPLNVYRLNLDHETITAISIHLCRFMVWIDTFALTASIYTLTFISFDRYRKIKNPALQYRSRMTTFKSLKIVFLIWFISSAVATYAATPHSGSWGILATGGRLCPSDVTKTKGFYTFLSVSAFCLPTLVILVMYSLIYVVVRKREKMLQNGELGQTHNDQNQRRAFRKDVKVIRMLLIIVGVFILCWAPYFIYILLVYYNPNFVDMYSRSFSNLRQTLTTLLVIRTALPYFNSLCNPIIYACLNKTYRKAFKNLLQRMMGPTSSRIRPLPNGIELHPVRT